MYDASALIHELQIFRDVLFRELSSHSVTLEDARRATLIAHLDATIRESADAFAVVQAALRVVIDLPIDARPFAGAPTAA